MSFRLWRRMKIAPGVTLNLSKSGGSISIGPRGNKFSIGPRGKHISLGIPGSGLFYTKRYSNKKQARSSTKKKFDKIENQSQNNLTLSFFKRLITPKEEENLVDGCRELTLGNDDMAYEYFCKASHLADGAFLAGFLVLKKGLYEDAEKYFVSALNQSRNLGRYFSKYYISASMDLPISNYISVQVGPEIRGVLIALVEVYQKQKKWNDAFNCLERLIKLEPDDPVILLSLVEILMETKPENADTCQKVIQLTEGVENESEIHAGLLLYKARALNQLGLKEASKDTLTKALRRKKDRPTDLLLELRYERALVYEYLGENKRSKSDLEKIYSESPKYKNVAEKLGLDDC